MLLIRSLITVFFFFFESSTDAVSLLLTPKCFPLEDGHHHTTPRQCGSESPRGAWQIQFAYRCVPLLVDYTITFGDICRRASILAPVHRAQYHSTFDLHEDRMNAHIKLGEVLE